jgi:hypothetical protein
MLVKHALYHNNSSSFCSSYFGEEGLWTIAQFGLKLPLKIAIVSGITVMISFSGSLLLVYKNYTGFHMLILCAATLLNLFFSSKSLLVMSLGIVSCYLLTVIIWLSPVLFVCGFFLFLIALAKISNSMLNKSEKWKYISLSCSRTLSHFPLSLWCWLWIYNIYHLLCELSSFYT